MVHWLKFNRVKALRFNFRFKEGQYWSLFTAKVINVKKFNLKSWRG